MYSINSRSKYYRYISLDEFSENLVFINDNFRLLFEAYSKRSPYLKNIDNAFMRLKKDVTDVKAKNDLIKNVSAFTGVKKIYFQVNKQIGLNAGVLPVLKKDLLIRKKGKVSLDTKQIQDDSSYIDTFYIIFGEKIIKTLQARELTAVLLHELGHVYNHFSRFTTILINVLKVLSSRYTVSFSSIMLIQHGLQNIFLFVALFLTAYIVSRTLTFIDHMEEYKSDEFAVKYGYGKEMASVLYKFHNIERRLTKSDGLIKKILRYILNVIFGVSTHPDSKNRVCKTIDKMINDYKKMYPKISSDIAKMTIELKC